MKPFHTVLLLLVAMHLGTKGHAEQGIQRQSQSEHQTGLPLKPPPFSASMVPAGNIGVPASNRKSNESQKVIVEINRDAAPRKDGWDYAAFWIQVALALIALVAGRLAFRTLKATEIAAYAARDANERAIRAERAWLTIVKAELVGNKPGEPGTIYIQCAVKNIGKTHARVLGIKAMMDVGPINEPEKSRNELDLQREENWTPKWTIFPDKTTALHARVPGVEGTAGDKLFSAVMPGETQFIHGTVYYWDAFTETDRISAFCFRNFNIDEFGKSAIGFHPVGAPEVNHQT